MAKIEKARHQDDEAEQRKSSGRFWSMTALKAVMDRQSESVFAEHLLSIEGL
jgi:hypothetical protein